jgi:hypothetical protein
MNAKEFTSLHTRWLKVRQGYLMETEKTSVMLAGCSPKPLPFVKRFSILRQEVIENKAHESYMAAKGLLHRAALLDTKPVDPNRRKRQVGS